MPSATAFETCSRCGRERVAVDDWLEVDEGTVCPNCFTADEKQFVAEHVEREAAEFMGLVEQEHETPEDDRNV